MTAENQKDMVARITAKLTDEGKLIEAGWVSLRMMTLEDASPIQQQEMRMAFFAGAQHVFGSIMNRL